MDSIKALEDNNKRTGRTKHKKLLIGVSASLLLIILITILFFGFRAWHASQQFIPNAIKKQVTYTIFKPTENANVIADKSTVKYDGGVKLLSYVAAQKDTGNKLTFSFQETPESFVDIPQAYDKFTESLHQYSSFDSVQGKVSLTKPTELKGGQSAVMSAKGALMFVRPDKNLSDADWKLLFNNLEIVK